MGLFPTLADELRPLVAEAAAGGVMLGTSSWKYPGWIGLLYDAARYEVRGRFSQAKFERECLTEYASVFPTVCVDAAYYRFPPREWLEELADQVPPGFRFGFKATSEVTVKQFPRHPRYGERAGRPNPGFLDPDLFTRGFLDPCAAIRDKVGLIMLEFSHFHAGEFERGRDFVRLLDAFLGALPPGWPLGVEIRNRTFLHPEYFAVLRAHGVTPVWNNWTDMPPVEEQMAMPGASCGEMEAARFLLTPGRDYEAAVAAFSPYRETRQADPSARRAGAEMIGKTLRLRAGRHAWIYVNNRLEGNALFTIRAMLAAAGLG